MVHTTWHWSTPLPACHLSQRGRYHIPTVEEKKIIDDIITFQFVTNMNENFHIHVYIEKYLESFSVFLCISDDIPFSPFLPNSVYTLLLFFILYFPLSTLCFLFPLHPSLPSYTWINHIITHVINATACVSFSTVVFFFLSLLHFLIFSSSSSSSSSSSPMLYFPGNQWWIKRGLSCNFSKVSLNTNSVLDI